MCFCVPYIFLVPVSSCLLSFFSSLSRFSSLRQVACFSVTIFFQCSLLRRLSYVVFTLSLSLFIFHWFLMGIIFVDNMCSLGTIQIVLNLVVAATHAGFLFWLYFWFCLCFLGRVYVLGGNKKGSGLVHVGWRDSLLDFVTPTPHGLLFLAK
jgi:hypothetical protein